MPLQACQHTTNITEHNLQLYSQWIFPAHLLRHLPSVSKYQNMALHFILLMPTDHTVCALQLLQEKKKKYAYNVAGHQLFVDLKKTYDSVRTKVLYNILLSVVLPSNW